MNEAVWFVILQGQQEGPFSIQDLKKIKGITPDTLAWKMGMKNWTPMRDIPELEILFKDESPSQFEEIEVKSKTGPITDLVLQLPNAQPPLLFWLMMIIIIFIIYGLFQIIFSS